MRLNRAIRDHAATVILAAMMAGAVVFCARQTKAQEIPQEETKNLQSRLRGIASPGATQLAEALDIGAPVQEPPADFMQDYLQNVGDLDGEGVSEYVLNWTEGQTAAPAAGEAVAPAWALYLLNWDGARWRALPLMGGFEPFSVQVLPAVEPGARAIAVTVFAGATRIPYPAIFKFQAHSAALAWDARSDASRYEGYDQGAVQFHASKGALEMIATGRAEPGFLVFPRTGPRGFDAQTVYHWESNAFIPVKTEYTPNRDFTLYRFIAALHVHDFKTAYGVIDPALFLKKRKPSLAAFRKMMEDQFPEFLDEQIFRAEDSGSGDDSFKLELTDKVYVYTPSFSGGPRFLLTGLGRQERQPEDD